MKLSEDEFRCLEAFPQITYPEPGCVSFKWFSSYFDWDRSKVRRVVRSLAAGGFAEYHRGLFTEDGDVAGSGYCITDAGRAALQAQENKDE
jgi:hypothetical protein